MKLFDFEVAHSSPIHPANDLLLLAPSSNEQVNGCKTERQGYFGLLVAELNCFCGMVDRRKPFSLISSRDHCHISSPPRISDMPRLGFEAAQNLSLELVA